MTDDSYFDQDDESGQIRRKYSDNAFIEAVSEHMPASTDEVAQSVGCSSDNAYRRLKRLEEAGEIRSKMVGNSLTWMPADD